MGQHPTPQAKLSVLLRQVPSQQISPSSHGSASLHGQFPCRSHSTEQHVPPLQPKFPVKQQSPLPSQKPSQHVPPLQPTFGGGQQLPWLSQNPPGQQSPPLHTSSLGRH